MRMLYATDLHGDWRKHEALGRIAVKEGISLILLGGDILGYGGGPEAQKAELRDELAPWLDSLKAAGVDLLCITGNMDIPAVDGLLSEALAARGMENASFALATRGGIEFVGFPLINDPPLGPKDRCRLDRAGGALPFQIAPPYRWGADGKEKIRGWKEEALSLPTIEEELSKLPRPSDPARAVLMIHPPPSGCGLDVCASGIKAGSAAVRAYIERSGAPLVLCGHIHESPRVSGEWKAMIGGTLVIQPGQSGRGALDYVTIEMPDNRRDGRPAPIAQRFTLALP